MKKTILIIGCIATLILSIMWYIDIISEPLVAVGTGILTLLTLIFAPENYDKSNNTKITLKHNGRGDNVAGNKIIKKKLRLKQEPNSQGDNVGGDKYVQNFYHTSTEFEKPIIISKLNLSPNNKIGLYATASNRTLTNNYSILLIVEEGISFTSSLFSLVNDCYVSNKYGRLFFGKAYQRIVSPSFGHPISNGLEINLFNENDNISFDSKGDWTELLIITEINVPGDSNPVINKIKFIKDPGGYVVKYSHEENI